VSSGRSYLRSGLRALWWLAAGAVITVAALLSAARLLLPYAGAYHADVARWVGAVLEHPVEIRGLNAGWHGLGPSIELAGVTIFDEQRRPLLRCRAARIDIDLFASLRHFQIELGRLTVQGAEAALLRKEDGSLVLMGLDGVETPPDETGRQKFRAWLARQPRLAVEDSRLEWRDLMTGGRHYQFRGVHAELRNRAAQHRIEAAAELPAELGRQLILKADLDGDMFTPGAWNGAIYAKGEALELGVAGTQLSPDLDLRGGRLDFEMWSHWRNGLQRLAGAVSAADMRVALRSADKTAAPAQPAPVLAAESPPAPADDVAAAPPVEHLLAVADAQGRFQWQRSADGWALDADHVSIRHEQGMAVSPAEWRVVYWQDAQSRHVEAGVSVVQIEHILPLLREAGALPADQDVRLAALAPRGELRDGYLRYQWGGATTAALLLRSDFRELAWTAAEHIPGVSGLNGTLASDGARAVVSLGDSAGVVDAVALFRAPLAYQQLRGHLAWRRLDGGWQLASDDLEVRNEDVHARAALRVLQVDVLAKPYLDLYTAFGDGNGAHATRYLPARIMHPQAVEWLDRAIVAGRVSAGSARLEGWLNQFPFDRGGGVFIVGFKVNSGLLDYAPGWPRLRDIDTDVLFNGRRLELTARAGKAFNSTLIGATVTVDDLAGDPAVVVINGSARGPTADALRFVIESPLREKFGEYLAGMSATGQSRLDLSMNLPLAKRPLKIDGTLHFDNSSLKLTEPELEITAIDGALGFYEDGLRARDIHARLFDQPAVVGVRTETASHATVFEALGMADAKGVSDKFLPALAPHVSGIAPWRGVLRMAGADKGGALLQISSPLTGVAVMLPEPLGKSADSERRLNIDLPLPLKGARATRVQYAGLLDARLLVADADGEVGLRRAEIRFGGGGPAVLPQEDVLRVRGRVPQLAVGEWLALRPATGNGGASQGRGPNADLALETDVLRVMGQSFTKAAVRARRAHAAWEVEVDGADAAGSLQIPDGDGPLTARLARLHLAVASDQEVKGGDVGNRPDPRTFPTLQVDIGDFRYGKLELGQTKLRLVRSGQGISVEVFKAESPLHKLDIRGRWEREDDGRQQSVFGFAFDSDDVGDTLRGLGYADVIKGGKMHTDMNLIWPGSPADFALARAAGPVTISIKEGRLLDVNPGAGRVLGLLSFQALPRRLTLDFSDLFQKGFAFDAIEGDFTVENGNARTDNLVMDGPAAHIVARGRVGLTAEDYDQRVTVTPNVSAGLPLAGALAGGVAGGAAALLVERLLKQQIDKIGRVEYQVTGPWSAPAVERVAGAAKDETRK